MIERDERERETITASLFAFQHGMRHQTVRCLHDMKMRVTASIVKTNDETVIS